LLDEAQHAPEPSRRQKALKLALEVRRRLAFALDALERFRALPIDAVPCGCSQSAAASLPAWMAGQVVSVDLR
jgi:hypothetical protein